jgi:predicted DNA-binding protein
MKKQLYKPVLVNLEPPLIEALDDLARELGSTRAWLIRRALNEFLNAVPEPETQSQRPNRFDVVAASSQSE